MVQSYFKAPRTKVNAQFERNMCHQNAGYQCQVQVHGCLGQSTHAHHVLPRSQGGADTTDNLLACCESCHRLIHAFPAASYADGWLRRKHPRPGDAAYVAVGE